MPKKKRTLKQKVQSDVRRHSTHTMTHHESDGQTFSLPQSYFTPTQKIPATPRVTTIATNEYRYLGRDLFKTMFLTGTIVLIEILIRYVIERG